MKLVKGRIWAQQVFEPGSRPGPAVICRWIVEQQVPGVVIDGRPYVYADLFAVQGTSVRKPSARAAALLS